MTYKKSNLTTEPHSSHSRVYFPYGNGQEAVFIHIPKNGGTTIRHSILRINPHEEFDGQYTGHYTADQVVRKYGLKRYVDAFSFAFLREPFGRFLSWARYMKREDTYQIFHKQVPRLMNFCREHTAEEIFEQLYQNSKGNYPDDINLYWNTHLRPQRHFVDVAGHPLVKFLGTTDRLNHDMKAISVILGIPIPEKFTNVNVSPKNMLKDAEENPILRERVRDFYAEDCELYEFVRYK